MSLKVEVPNEFTAWVSEIERTAALLLIKALNAVCEDVLGSWEGDIDGVKITKVANEHPELFRMCILIVDPQLCVLYGLCGNYMVIGAWGELQVVSRTDTIKKAQAEIQSFKEKNHG